VVQSKSKVLGKCKICGKDVNREMITCVPEDHPDSEGWVFYHESFGFVCCHHKGIHDLYDSLIDDANKKLESSLEKHK